jgi:hypothetical protein
VGGMCWHRWVGSCARTVTINRGPVSRRFSAAHSSDAIGDGGEQTVAWDSIPNTSTAVTPAGARLGARGLAPLGVLRVLGVLLHSCVMGVVTGRRRRLYVVVPRCRGW